MHKTTTDGKEFITTITMLARPTLCCGRKTWLTFECAIYSIDITMSEANVQDLDKGGMNLI